MNDWKQKFIAMSNHDAETHNDLRCSGIMRSRKLCESEEMIPHFLLAKEHERLDAYVMYNSFNLY